MEFPDDRHDEDEYRNDVRNVIFAGVGVVLVLAGLYTWFRVLPLRRAAAQAEQAAMTEGVPRSSAALSGTRAAAGCALAIGEQGAGTPAATAIQVRPGAPVAVAVKCPAGVQVVDLVVAAPPPAGAMLVLPTQPGAGANGSVVWSWQGELAELESGTTLMFYGYADGLPLDGSVTLVVNGPPF